MPSLNFVKFLSAEDAGREYAAIICRELDRKRTLEEAVRTAYRTHGVIKPSLLTRWLFNDPYFEAMFGAMALTIQNCGHSEIIADPPAWLHPFRRLRRTMGEVSQEMYER
jgi:hypothetical protein